MRDTQVLTKLMSANTTDKYEGIMVLAKAGMTTEDICNMTTASISKVEEVQGKTKVPMYTVTVGTKVVKVSMEDFKYIAGHLRNKHDAIVASGGYVYFGSTTVDKKSVKGLSKVPNMYEGVRAYLEKYHKMKPEDIGWYTSSVWHGSKNPLNTVEDIDSLLATFK